MRRGSVRDRRQGKSSARSSGARGSTRGAAKHATATAAKRSTLSAALRLRGVGPKNAAAFVQTGHMVHRAVLPNGLCVITVPQPQLHSASVAVLVKVGARHETSRDNGISHLLEHMLFRGSARYPSAYTLNRAIEELGGTLHGATHADFTLFEVTLPPGNVQRGIEILGELFARPSFAELAVEKRIVREEILEYLDEEGREVDPDNISRELMFGTHPLGMTITGNLENVARFEVRDLQQHMQRHYVASNMVLCVAGAVDERAVVRSALQHFGTLRTGAPSNVNPAPLHRASERFRTVVSQGSQTDVRLSFPTFGANDPRYLALELLVRVIDDGMSTRLHRRICEELGLAYEVFATLEPYDEAGVLDVGAAVEHSKTPVFVRAALGLLEELRNRPVGKQELEKAKRRYQWQLEAILDDAQAMCAHYGQRALVGQEGHIGALREQIANVTATELRAVAREVLCRDGLHLVTVGMLDRAQRKSVRRAMTKLSPRTLRRIHAV
jgi:predicted Zn-dependent peptidase